MCFHIWGGVIRVAGKTAIGKKNEETGGMQQQEEDGINCAQTTATASVGVAVSDNGVTANVVEIEGMADSEETDAGSPKRTGESAAASEDDVVNRTPEREYDGEEEEDESDTEHPGNVSIGKKLWTFLTT
ncbi:hypothetical protein F2Q68_00010298 [Brassica cretica]|uniref:Uncharacterized protein n=1 Tax=Brassica cretica TaxID=69181 RepID=A0A8S9KZK9_BRACR|nr:hypothetical protein F2Q68_00010298 [Brassica cretica]